MQIKVNQFLLIGAALVSLEGLAKAEVSFKKQVQPVLASACLSCHGEKNDKGELRLHTQEGLLEGGEYGKVVVPGKPEKSSIYTSTVLPPDDDDIMPPKGEPLTIDQANVIKEWIAAGAKWPEGLVIQQVRRIDFAKDIKPILESSCVSCHREGHDKGDLRLDEREYAFEAGEYGTAVVPFDLEKSTLYQSVTLPANHDDLMPPSNKGGPLPQEQLDLLRDWIVQGAAWPEGLKLEQTRRDTGKQPVAGESLSAAPKVVIDIRTKAVEKLIRQLEPTMKPYEEEIPGTGVKFDMVPIPSGEFVMGSPADEPGREATEGPTHTVKIAPFWMGKTETTWNTYTLFIYEEEERMVMKIRGYKPELNAVSDAVARPTTPYVEMSFGMGTDDFPAISMTQYAANTYCKWLTAKTGHYYRLPTEAEWVRAGRYADGTGPSRFPWGDALPPPESFANLADSAAMGLAPNIIADYTDGFRGPAPVGHFEANALGIFDLSGNVAEWTHDRFSTARSTTVELDWMGPETGEVFVIRGSSFLTGTFSALRWAYRDSGREGRQDLGFRLARDVSRGD